MLPIHTVFHRARRGKAELQTKCFRRQSAIRPRSPSDKPRAQTASDWLRKIHPRVVSPTNEKARLLSFPIVSLSFDSTHCCVFRHHEHHFVTACCFSNSIILGPLESEWDMHHAARNKFERFRRRGERVLELFSRFEFDFSSLRKLFFERFEFLACSKFNHTQCGRTCACAVACLCPHNSISNVVVSLTIHDNLRNINIYENIYRRCLEKT